MIEFTHLKTDITLEKNSEIIGRMFVVLDLEINKKAECTRLKWLLWIIKNKRKMKESVFIINRFYVDFTTGRKTSFNIKSNPHRKENQTQ